MNSRNFSHRITYLCYQTLCEYVCKIKSGITSIFRVRNKGFFSSIPDLVIMCFEYGGDDTLLLFLLEEFVKIDAMDVDVDNKSCKSVTSMLH
jgi:hypothetical protein